MLLFDFCVVGGGMVGSALALGLEKMGFSIALIEEYPPAPFAPEQKPDMRVSAINLASEELLNSLGAWRHIQTMRSCVYRRLSVWDDQQCRTDFDSHSIGKSHLGHIIENRLMQLALHQEIENCANIKCFFGQGVNSIESSENQSSLILTSGEGITSKLLIGADGGRSMVRQSAKIGSQGWQYKQQVFAVNIKTNQPQQDITWQQFTPQGPLAFLPLYENYACLIWYTHSKQVHALKSMSSQQLKQNIEQTFPTELCDFEILSTASFPLTRMHANQYVKGNTALIGDAAHTINPLAGQGVNLGFKDVAVLLEQLNQTAKQKGHASVLKDQAWLLEYEKLRRRDNLTMMSAMDLLYGTFSNDILPLKLLRNLGLKLANNAGPLKTQALKYAVGLG